VFINYRGEDSHSYGALLYQELTSRFGRDLVFLDAESIPAGADFSEELIGRVRSARLLLAVIGLRWLSATDPATGGRRIDNPADWVRRELAEAFAAGVRVIPVLTDHADLPGAAELPAEIAALSRCQYRHLRRREPTSDLARIVTDLISLDPALAAAVRSRENGPLHPSAAARTSTEVPGPTGVSRGRGPYYVDRDLHIQRTSSTSVPVRRKIWGSVPARNPGFTGRASRLTAIRDALASGDYAVVQALHGMGGVGKTQLAVEYAHRHEGDYTIIWWLNSETKALLGEEFAALAAELSCAAPGTSLDVMRRAVLAALHERDDWLLIFDNAEAPQDIADWLPGGRGHVLITSRASNWHDLAVPVEVDVFTRSESIGALRRRVPYLSDHDAAHVAEAVGDLPLAIAQAASYMALTGIPPDEYLPLLNERPTEILRHGTPWSYPRSLAAATILSLDRLRTADLAAAEAAAICAFLAPEPVPAAWFPRAAEHLPAPLGERAADTIAWRHLIARLRSSSLVRLNGGSLQMHRLTLAIIHETLSAEQTRIARGAAIRVITANHPGEADLPAAWPAWATILPHVLALDPANSGDADLRSLAAHASLYVCWRGDLRAGIDFAQHLHGQWSVALGSDHPDTLRPANIVAFALHELGEDRAARDLHEDVLERRRRVLGEDHPDTLWSAVYLARDLRGLGEYEAARGLSEDVLARCRRMLGEDHPQTLWQATELASALRGLGDYGAARDLDQDALARYRRVMGENHHDTLRSAAGLARDLEALREH